MPWLAPDNYRSNPGEIQAGFRLASPGPVQEWMTRHRRTWQDVAADAIRAAAPGVTHYLDQRRNDEIANAVKQMYGQQAAGQPVTNDLQGQQWLKAQSLYQDQISQQPDTAMDDLKYQEEWNKVHPDQAPQAGDYDPEEAATNPNGPGYVNTPYGVMTAHQWASDQRNPDAPKRDRYQYASPIAQGWLKKDGSFTNTPADVGLPDDTDAGKVGTHMKVQLPNNKTEVIPFAQWQARQQSASPAANAYQSAITSDGGGQKATAVGTRVRQNGVVYEFDGTNWNQVE